MNIAKQEIEENVNNENMSFTKNQITELIEYLQGTCKSLDEGVNDVLSTNPRLDFEASDLSEENTAQIDDEIFNCTTCSWWHEISEMSENKDGQVCVECNND